MMIKEWTEVIQFSIDKQTIAYKKLNYPVVMEWSTESQYSPGYNIDLFADFGSFFKIWSLSIDSSFYSWSEYFNQMVFYKNELPSENIISVFYNLNFKIDDK